MTREPGRHEPGRTDIAEYAWILALPIGLAVGALIGMLIGHVGAGIALGLSVGVGRQIDPASAFEEHPGLTIG